MSENKPLYLTIYDDLKQKILEGTIHPGERLSTELELSKAYSVSRITSKRALNELENHGLINRKQGKGSFVNSPLNITKSKNILFVSPFASAPELGNYTSGINMEAENQAYQVISMDIGSFATLNTKHLKEQYAGVIYYPQNIYDDAESIYQLYLSGVPLVILDKELAALTELNLATVASDNFEGGRKATEYLISLGHKKILFYAQVESEALANSVYDRYFGYLNVLHKNGLESVCHLRDLRKLNAVNDEKLVAFLKTNKITAIVVENDLTAIKLINRLRNADSELLSKLSIIGFDNIQAASLSFPTLTTIAQDFQGMGKTAVNLLLAQIHSHNKNIQHIKSPIKLIKRDSTQKR